MNFYFGKRQMILMMMMMTLRNKRKICERIIVAEADNLEDVKGFRGQGVHSILCATENL
jgi:hypothetical protein